MSKPTFCVKVIYKNSIPSLAFTCNCVEVYIYGEMSLMYFTQNGHLKRSRAVVLMEECFRGLAWRSVFTVIGSTIMESIWTQLGSGCLYQLREIPMSHTPGHMGAPLRMGRALTPSDPQGFKTQTTRKDSHGDWISHSEMIAENLSPVPFAHK